MKVGLGVLLIGVVFIVLILDKKQVHKMFERLSIYWFRLAFSFLLLFIMNVAGGFFGVYVPVNIVSGLVITVFGIPGLASIFTFALFL